MSKRPSLLSGLSAFQVAAGSLAAMTSAWVASTLGVAGTIVGAAIASLVLSTSSAVYANTLHKGRTLVVQTADGSVVEREAEAGETAEVLAEVAEEAGSPVQSAEVEEETRAPLPWRRIAVTTVVVLTIALGGIWTYEQVTDRSYGTGSDNARISNPFGGGTGGSGTDPAPTEPGEPAPDETGDADTEPVQPDEPAPSPTPTPTPAPTPTPTPAPVPTPTPAG